MRLNELKPNEGSKKVKMRLGRGIGCGKGKTCGKGHKGQTARAGGYHKVGFEGGQMPIQRRLPKFGFTSRQSLSTVELRVADLHALKETQVTLKTLKSAGLVLHNIKHVKIMLGRGASLTQAYTVSGKGVAVSKGARAQIEVAGGKVEV